MNHLSAHRATMPRAAGALAVCLLALPRIAYSLTSVLLADVKLGSQWSHSAPWPGAVLGPNLLFFAYSASSYELWRTDGSVAGTTLVDALGGSANSKWSLALDQRMLFEGPATGSGQEPWVSEGLPGSTGLLADACPGSCPSSPSPCGSLAGTLLFRTTDRVGAGNELWRTDGTPGGTLLVRAFPKTSGTTILAGHPLGTESFFTAWDAANGFELWRTDGSTAGTWLLKDICPGSCDSTPEWFVQLGNALLFQAGDGIAGLELWRTEGTPATTRLVRDICPGSCDSAPAAPQVFGNRILFWASEAAAGFEPWISDGSAAGTALLKDLNPGAASSWTSVADPWVAAVLDGIAYFRAKDADHGSELWRTDGTAAGTWMVRDIWPGTASAEPAGLVVSAGRLWFFAKHAATGKELWTSDGTEGGTVLAADILPGAASSQGSFVPWIATLGSRLVFAANDGQHGMEPMAVELDPNMRVLLRNDDVRSLAPLSPPLASLLPLDLARSGYLAVLPGDQDPELNTVWDWTRPLVLYALEGPGTLYLTKASNRHVQIDY